MQKESEANLQKKIELLEEEKTSFEERKDTIQNLSIDYEHLCTRVSALQTLYSEVNYWIAKGYHKAIE